MGLHGVTLQKVFHFAHCVFLLASNFKFNRVFLIKNKFRQISQFWKYKIKMKVNRKWTQCGMLLTTLFTLINSHLFRLTKYGKSVRKINPYYFIGHRYVMTRFIEPSLLVDKSLESWHGKAKTLYRQTGKKDETKQSPYIMH